MKYILTLLFLTSISVQSQIDIFGKYAIDHATVTSNLNRDNIYMWLADDGMIFMNFPKNVDGLGNIDDKVKYIAILNGLDPDQPTWDKSLIPKKYKSENDLKIINQAIINGEISINCGWELDNLEAVVTCNKGEYRLTVQVKNE